MTLTSEEFKGGYAVFQPVTNDDGSKGKEIVTRTVSEADAKDYIARRKSGEEA